MAPFNPAVYYNNNPLPDIDIEMVVKIKHSARGLADAPQIDVNGLEIKVSVGLQGGHCFVAISNGSPIRITSSN